MTNEKPDTSEFALQGSSFQYSVLPPIREQPLRDLPPGFKLRELQEVMRRNLAQSFLQGKRRPVVMAPTGGGKTIFAGYLFHNMLKKNPNQRLIFIVPRNTLLEQTAEVFRDVFGFEVSIIQGLDTRLDLAKQVHVATIQTLKNRIEKHEAFQKLNFGMSIVDECFGGETEVCTPKGKKLISNVRSGEVVYNAIGTGVVEAVTVSNKHRIIRMELSNGKTIRCTENHPLFTREGWVDAGELGIGSRLFSREDVSDLWGSIQAKDWESLEVREGWEVDKSREDLCSGARESMGREADLLSILFKEIEKSDGQQSNKRESFKEITGDWSQAPDSRGERKRADSTSKNDIGYSWGRMDSRACSKNKSEGIHGEKDASPLQDRYCKPSGEDSYRGGRSQSSEPSKTRARQEERLVLGSIRVESYQVEEPEGGELVYNLQVSGHPSYYANGALAHNCHIQFEARELIQSDIIVGVTATPYSKGMGLFYDDLVKSIPARELTEQGIITPIRVQSAQVQIDKSKLRVTSTGEYNAQDEEQEAEKIIGDVVKEYENNPDMENRPFLGFSKNISTCVALTEAFTEKGHKVAYVHSKMSDDDCKAVLETFKAGLLDGVFSVVKLIEGFDYPEASALLICTSFAPNKKEPGEPNALNRYVQMFGRGRRSAEGKENCLVHDHGENYIQYGHPDLFELGFDDLDTGKEPDEKEDDEPGEKDIKPKVCPECSNYIDRGNICPACGHELQTYTDFVEGKVINFVDGKMVEVQSDKGEIGGKKKKYSMEEKREIYAGIKNEYALINMRKKDDGKPPMAKGWIAHKYKAMCGVWPKGMDDVKPKMVEKVRNYITYENIKYANRNKKNEK